MVSGGVGMMLMLLKVMILIGIGVLCYLHYSALNSVEEEGYSIAKRPAAAIDNPQIWLHHH